MHGLLVIFIDFINMRTSCGFLLFISIHNLMALVFKCVQIPTLIYIFIIFNKNSVTKYSVCIILASIIFILAFLIKGLITFSMEEVRFQLQVYTCCY